MRVLHSHHFSLPGYSHPLFRRNRPAAPILLLPISKALPSPSKPLSFSNPPPNSSDFDSPSSCDGDGDDYEIESEPSASSSNREFGIASSEAAVIEVEKVGKNSRRISSRIGIDASLETVWNILTDYERLADFIPGLAVSQLLEKKENFAKIFQMPGMQPSKLYVLNFNIEKVYLMKATVTVDAVYESVVEVGYGSTDNGIGQQNLAFGLKFNAKGIVDCYERDLEHLSFGVKRDIEFKMVEGDFQTFEGKWSITQADIGHTENRDLTKQKEFQTVLQYIVHVEPKLWLPVGLVEGRLCKEIEVNLVCIREEAQRQVLSALS
ncbi:hypothetical protein ACLOJK_015798 [Asimina triloba]